MPTAKAQIRARPIRIAYLVDENEHWRPMLEAIFAECYGRWGGRFSLIVPCADNAIRTAYLPWLRAYDADVIYSYVDLPDTYIERLHELLYPAFLTLHRFHRVERNRHAFRPSLPVNPLSSLSVALAASRGNAISESQPLALTDIVHGTEPSRLLQENFGCYGESIGAWPLARDMTPYVRTLTVAPKLAAAMSYGVLETETLPTELDLLQQIAKQRSLVGMAQMSAWLTPRLEINNPGWTGSASIIVGDGFIDRITFWNGRFHFPAWLNGSIVTLKLSPEDIRKPDVFDAILGIIRWRVHASGDSNSEQIVIRSASLSDAELEEIQSLFREKDTWKRFSFAKLKSVDECVPSQFVLDQALPYVEGHAFVQKGDWHEISYSETGFRPPTVLPQHIRDTTPLPSGAQGAWALDLDIERTADYSRYENVQHRWRLPRRMRVTTAFNRGYQVGGHGQPCAPRVTRYGLLSLFGMPGGQLPELRVPDDETAFRYALCHPRDWFPFTHGRGPFQNSLVFDVRPSDKGRYLTALLRLADGVHRSKQLFLHKFWKTQFEILGATSAGDDERLPDLVRTLKKRLPSGAIETDDHWQRLARVVRAEARAIRLAPRYLRFDHLQKCFDEYRNEFWSKHEPATPRSDWDEQEKRTLTESIQYVCQRQILHQGHEWRCPKCNNNNWVGIDDLGASLQCAICGTVEPAPVSDAWRFKLDPFILEGLRDHGLLASVWCLGRLVEKANASFFFLEPHELFFTTGSADSRTSDAEIDLIAVADGVVKLCEIKSSSQNIDVKKFSDLARRLRPDIAVLAVMEPASGSLERRRAELQEYLKADNIEVELLTLEDGDIEDDPYLPTGWSSLIRL